MKTTTNWIDEVESVCKETDSTYEVYNEEYEAIMFYFADGSELKLRHFRGYWELYGYHVWNSLKYTPQQQPMGLSEFINDIIERCPSKKIKKQ